MVSCQKVITLIRLFCMTRYENCLYQEHCIKTAYFLNLFPSSVYPIMSLQSDNRSMLHDLAYLYPRVNSSYLKGYILLSYGKVACSGIAVTVWLWIIQSKIPKINRSSVKCFNLITNLVEWSCAQVLAYQIVLLLLF